jgi:hypothetical protein
MTIGGAADRGGTVDPSRCTGDRDSVGAAPAAPASDALSPEELTGECRAWLDDSPHVLVDGDAVGRQLVVLGPRDVAGLDW